MANPVVETQVVINDQAVEAQSPDNIAVLNNQANGEPEQKVKGGFIGRTYQKAKSAGKKFFKHPAVKAVGKGIVYVTGMAVAGAAVGAASTWAMEKVEERHAKKLEHTDAIEINTEVKLIGEGDQPDILPDDFDTSEGIIGE